MQLKHIRIKADLAKEEHEKYFCDMKKRLDDEHAGAVPRIAKGNLFLIELSTN